MDRAPYHHKDSLWDGGTISDREGKPIATAVTSEDGKAIVAALNRVTTVVSVTWDNDSGLTTELFANRDAAYRYIFASLHGDALLEADAYATAMADLDAPDADTHKRIDETLWHALEDTDTDICLTEHQLPV